VPFESLSMGDVLALAVADIERKFSIGIRV